MTTPSPTRREVLQALASTAVFTLPAGRGARAATPSPFAQKVRPFALTCVRLLPGPLATARDLDAKYLLSLEPDRLLHHFKVNAGLAPKAPA